MGQTEIVKSEDRHDHGQQNKTKDNEPLKAIAMKYHRIFTTMSNTTGVTSRAGVAYPSGAPERTLVFVGFVLLQLWFSV